MRRDGTSSPPERQFSDRRFGPERRLRRRRDFTKVLSAGTRLHARVVTVVVLPNGANHPRLGLAVPRRVARRAVARHRLKRRIRESFRHNSERLGGLDVVVLANPGLENMDSSRFRDVLARAWERAGEWARRAGKGHRRERGA